MAQPTLDQLKKEIDQLAKQLGKKGIDIVNIKTLDEAKTILKGLRAEADELNTTFGDLSKTLKNIVSEISKSDTATKDATKAYRGLVSVAQKMQYEEEGIYSYNTKQLKNLHEQAKAQLTNLKSAAENLSKAEKTSKEGRAILKALESQFKIEQLLLDQIERRLQLEKQVEKTFGATGALIEGSSKLLSTMGFGHLSSELSELNDKLKSELREELDKAGGSANRLGLSFKYMGKGLAGSAKIFADGLKDPLFISGKILDTYLEINKASVEVQRLTGQNAVTAASWNTSLATAKDYLETVVELTKETGRNAQNVFDKRVISQAAELKTFMGLTAEEAGGLALMSQTSGKSVKSMTDSIVATASSFNKANRSAVSQGQILRDVANTSESIKLSLGNNDVLISKAASAARRLGMDLAKVDQIAGSLMNFEDSIGKELEAELLTGKQLNLEKARELALTNDLEGLSKELFKNSSDIHEFGKMNRIQQESYAAALGMTRDELARIAYTRALDAGMTEKQAADAAKVNAEDMKRITAQENFANALAKIAGALAPILDIVGSILNLPLAPYFILAAIAVKSLGFSVMGVGKAFGTMFNLGKQALLGIANFAKAPLQGLKAIGSKLAGGFNQGATGMGASSPWSPGKQGPVQGPTQAISKIPAGDLIKGAAAMAIASVGIYIFAKAVQELAKVEDWGRVAIGLGLFAATMVALGFAMQIAAPAIAVGVGPLLAFGGAVLLIGAGIGLAAAGMSMFVDSISKLTIDSIAPMLLLGPALFSIAAGLMAVGAAGLVALPGLAALAVVSKIAPSVVSTGEKTAGAAKGKAEEGSMAALEAKFDTLIELVKQGTTINLDGAKIATTVGRNLPRVQTATS